jgi:hypothetical protein
MALKSEARDAKKEARVPSIQTGSAPSGIGRPVGNSNGGRRQLQKRSLEFIF